MEYSLPVALGAVIALVVLGVVGLLTADVMRQGTVLMMVAPSMLVFGVLSFAIGVKHGQYRAV